jgi:hypothetical protein
MSELQQLLAMLSRAGIGHGRRTDWSPPGESGESVQVETGENETEFMVTEFGFDADGKLVTVVCYPGETG